MDRSHEAQKILIAIKENHFILRNHAVKRAEDRILSRQHVINVANSVIEWKWQEDKQTHWFIGFLEESQPGGFTAAIDGDVWIVTIFKRKLTRREKGLVK